MQVRFLPGLQIRDAGHLSGKTASSRMRRGGFLVQTTAMRSSFICISLRIDSFFIRRYLCRLTLFRSMIPPFLYIGPGMGVGTLMLVIFITGMVFLALGDTLRARIRLNFF